MKKDRGSDRVKLTKCDEVEWGENAIMQVTQFLNDPMFSLLSVLLSYYLFHIERK